MAGDREKAIAAGCDDFDTKPVDMSRLLDQISLTPWTQVLGEQLAIRNSEQESFLLRADEVIE
jgi:CheY-like chemotaxis protein